LTKLIIILIGITGVKLTKEVITWHAGMCFRDMWFSVQYCSRYKGHLQVKCG